MKTITDKQFTAEVQRVKSPVFVLFYHPQCGPCQLMKPIYTKISKKYGKKAKFVVMNVKNGMKTAEKYRVQATPTILVFKSGLDDTEIEGYTDEATLNGYCTRILGGP